MCWCLRRHGDVLDSGFRGFAADGDASANATTSILSRLVVVPARELIRFIDIYFCRIFFILSIYFKVPVVEHGSNVRSLWILGRIV